MSAFGAPFVHTIDGVEVSFPLFTCKHLEGLQNRVLERQKRENRALANELGLTGLDRGRFLQESDPRSISLSAIDVFLDDDRAAREVIEQSLNIGMYADQIDKLVEKLSPTDRVYLAKVIVGLIQLVAKPAPAVDPELTRPPTPEELGDVAAKRD